MKKTILHYCLPTLFCALSISAFAQPANDNCADAVAIGEVTDFSFTTVDATTDGPDHPSADCFPFGDNLVHQDVWYAYTATITGTISWSTCNTIDFDSRMAVYMPGAACPPMDTDLMVCNDDGTDETGVACGGFSSSLTFDAVAGETYLLRVGTYGDAGTPDAPGSGTFTLGEASPPPMPPANDACADAAVTMLGETAFTTLLATTDGPDHPDATCFPFGDNLVHQDVWYTFTAPNDAIIDWSTCNTVDFDTRLAVYSPGAACPPADADLLECNDDGVDEAGVDCGGFSSRLSFTVTAGETYLLRVGNYGDAAGNPDVAGSGTFSLTETIIDGAPDNDDCADAIAIGEVTDFGFSTIMATTDGNDHADNCPSGGSTPAVTYNDIWYNYTASFTGFVEWTMCGTANFDTKIFVYVPGSTCAPGDDAVYACNEDSGTCANATSAVIFEVTAGETYLLRLGGYGDGAPGEMGTGTFTIAETTPPPPAPDNDLCADAISVSLGETMFSNVNAMTDGPEHPTAPCFAFGDDFVNADVWYSFTAPNTATIDWSTCNLAPFDTRLAVYNAGAVCPVGDADLLACNDDGLDDFSNPCDDFTSRLTFDATAGETYILRIGGYTEADQGMGTFSLTEIIPEDPPANDDCATSAQPAMVVTPDMADDLDGLNEGTTVAGTQDAGVPPCINNGELFDVWYSFNSGPDTILETRFFGDINAAFILEVYEDCSTPALDVASGGAFNQTCIIYDAGTAEVADTISGFTPNTDYLIRVSTVITFETPGPFGFILVKVDESVNTNDIYTLDQVSFHPNPVQHTATVEMVLEEAATTRFEVVNSMGQLVRTEDKGRRASGVHQLDLNTAPLQPGVYFLRVVAGEKQRTLRFVKQ